MIRVLIFSIFLSTPLAAQETARHCQIGRMGVVVDAKPLNGTVNFKFGPRVCGRDVSSFTYLVIEVDYTHSNSGNIVVTCLTGQQRDAADKAPQLCDHVSSGTCVMVDTGKASKAVTGDKKYTFRLGVRGYRAWSCTTTHDGTPDANDVVTERAYLED
jgi:hypothetical protein